METNIRQGIGERLKNWAFHRRPVNYDPAWRVIVEEQIKESRERLDIAIQGLQELLDNPCSLSDEARTEKEENICQTTREIHLAGQRLAFYTSRLRHWNNGKRLPTWDRALGVRVLELLLGAYDETTLEPYKENCGKRYEKMRDAIPTWCNPAKEDVPDDNLVLAE